jgi:hypothetical protein
MHVFLLSLANVVSCDLTYLVRPKLLSDPIYKQFNSAAPWAAINIEVLTIHK